MNYLRLLYKTQPKDFKRTIDGKEYDIILSVVGVFDTQKVLWQYYYGSFVLINNNHYITNDCSTYTGITTLGTVSSISAFCHKTKSIEEGKRWCEDFKEKWETASNDLIPERREKKLNELLK